MPRFSSIIICSLALLAACDSAGPKFKSTDITGVEYGRTLELTDQNGKLRRLRALHPELQIRMIYQRDYLGLLAKYGLEPPEQWGLPA